MSAIAVAPEQRLEGGRRLVASVIGPMLGWVGSCEEIAPVVVPAFPIGSRLAGSGLRDTGLLPSSSAPPLLCSPNSCAVVWRV